MPDPEIQSTEQLKASLKALTASVANDLTREHGLDPSKTPNIQDSLFIDYSQTQMVSTLGEMGLNVEGGLGPACVFTLPYEQNAAAIEQVLWLDVKHPFIKGLKDFTDYNFEKHQQGFLIVAEEISHYFYKSQYFQRYGAEPPDWLTEMIGAMDKYNLLQNKYIERYGQPMTPQQEQRARGMIFTALDSPPGAPVEHAIGHTLAYNTVNHLNALASSGRQNQAGALFSQLYTANEATVRQLVPQRRTR